MELMLWGLLEIAGEMAFIPMIFACLAFTEAVLLLPLGVVIGSTTLGKKDRELLSGLALMAQKVGIWLAKGLGAIAAATFAVIFVANVLFSTTVGQVLDYASGRTGIEIQFAEAKGSLFRGECELSALQLYKPGHFNVQADRVHFDFAVMSMIMLEPGFDLIDIEGVSGTFYPQPKTNEPAKAKQATPIFVNHMKIDDVNITVKGNRDWHFGLIQLRSDDFHTDKAAFDLLFRSTFRGTVEGQEFGVTDVKEGSCRWVADNFSITALEAPWLTQGHFKLNVENKWLGAGPIDMHWHMTFNKLRAEAPKHVGGVKLTVTRKAFGWLNDHADEVDVDFNIEFDQEQFHGKPSIMSLGLWASVAETLFDELVEHAAAFLSSISQGISNKVDEITNSQPVESLKKSIWSLKEKWDGVDNQETGGGEAVRGDHRTQEEGVLK